EDQPDPGGADPGGDEFLRVLADLRRLSVEAVDQGVEHRGLARAGGPDDAEQTPVLEVEGGGHPVGAEALQAELKGPHAAPPPRVRRPRRSGPPRPAPRNRRGPSAGHGTRRRRRRGNAPDLRGPPPRRWGVAPRWPGPAPHRAGSCGPRPR